MKAPLPKTVLIIEDDAGLRGVLTAALAELGYEVRVCADAEEGLALAASFKPTLVFCDVHLDQGDGRKVLASLREKETLPDGQFVLMTGDWVGASRQASVALEADGYLAKPFSVPEFVACVETHFRQANL